jgi:hypothetical protein
VRIVQTSTRMGALPTLLPLCLSRVPLMQIAASAARSAGTSSRASPARRTVLTVTVLLRRDGVRSTSSWCIIRDCNVTIMTAQ